MVEKAIDLMPERWGQEPSFYYLKAQLLIDRDRCEEALKELDEATSRHGASAYYYFLLKADCHLMLRNFEKAQAEYLRSNLLLYIKKNFRFRLLSNWPKRTASSYFYEGIRI